MTSQPMTRFADLDPDVVGRALAPAVKTALAARAVAEVTREEVDAIAARILAENTYMSQYTGDRITEPRRAWMMDEVVFAGYAALVDAAVRAAGYDPEPGYCPALVAENTLLKAERALVTASEPFFGTSYDDLLSCSDGPAKQAKFVELLCGLVASTGHLES